MLKRKGYSEELYQAKLVIAELLGDDSKLLNIDNLPSDELKELKVFVEDPEGVNIYNLPGFLGDYLLEAKLDLTLWKGFSKLDSEDRKILIFSAFDHDPSMISESLNFPYPGMYWKKLEIVKNKLEDDGSLVYNKSSIKTLSDSLDIIINNYLLASDFVDIEKQKSKRRKTNIFAGSVGIIILSCSYLFFWNLIFPPNVDLMFENRVGKVQQYILDSGDTTDLLLEALDYIAIGDYESAGHMFEQLKLASTVIHPGILALEILLLLREREFLQVKTLSGDFRMQNPKIYQNHLKGIRWKIRFLYLYQ